MDPAQPQCINFIDVEIPEFNPLVAEVNVISNPNCGNTDGQVELNISGGSGTYNYVWSDAASIIDSLRTDLPAGDHTVTITDTDGSDCEIVASFTLIDYTPGANLTLIPGTSVSCNGDTDGTLEYEVTYEPGFLLPAVETIKDSLGNEYQNGDLAPGYYCLIITDDSGCVGAQECFEVTEPEVLFVTTNPTDADCDNGGSIDLVVTGGTGAYTYNWADISTNPEPADRTDLTPGNYIVTVTDENDCQAVAFNILIGNNCSCDDPQIENTIVLESACNASTGSIYYRYVGRGSLIIIMNGMLMLVQQM